ncbi:MAG: hypothetical protein IJK63_11770 [Oscillospiraceae bacterium]|nr:hypothetical protein [Oscillospiraceae bacterium]
MIPVPNHLRRLAVDAQERKGFVCFSLCCPCGSETFFLEQNDLSPKEKAAERNRSKALLRFYESCPYGFTYSYDDEGLHYWRFLSALGAKGEREEVFIPPAPLTPLFAVVRCRCPLCGETNTVFDSRLHGYDAVTSSDPPVPGGEATYFRLRTKHPVRLQVEIENDPSLEAFNNNSGLAFTEQQYADAFTWIIIRGISSAGKKVKLFDCETA